MHPVVFPNGGWIPPEKNDDNEDVQPVHGSAEWKQLEEIIQSDALAELTASDKAVLNKYRYLCKICFELDDNSVTFLPVQFEAANCICCVYVLQLLQYHLLC